jgi:hypothetical protein
MYTCKVQARDSNPHDECHNFPTLKEFKISWRRGRKVGMSIYPINLNKISTILKTYKDRAMKVNCKREWDIRLYSMKEKILSLKGLKD